MSRERRPTLSVRWSRKENDFVVNYPDSKATGGYILHWLLGERYTILSKDTGKTFGLKDHCGVDWNPNMRVFVDKKLIEELDARGYDTTTLKFSVQKKQTE